MKKDKLVKKKIKKKNELAFTVAINKLCEVLDGYRPCLGL